jgi:hypothetical protein
MTTSYIVGALVVIAIALFAILLKVSELLEKKNSGK